MYLYRAIDSNGDTVEFWFSERRDLTAAKRFLRKALKRHGWPERIVIDGSQTNKEAILLCDAESRLHDLSRRALKPIRVRQSAYLNNRIEQDHRAIKRRVRPMLGFQSMATARVILHRLCGHANERCEERLMTGTGTRPDRSSAHGECSTSCRLGTTEEGESSGDDREDDGCARNARSVRGRRQQGRYRRQPTDTGPALWSLS